MKAQNISLGEKDYLSPTESIQYWNLSNQKFYALWNKEADHPDRI